VEPVELFIERDHPFKRRPPEAGRKRLGCATCGRAKMHTDHLGAPSSLRMFGSGARQIHQAQKRAWQDLLTVHLAASGLPRGRAR